MAELTGRTPAPPKRREPAPERSARRDEALDRRARQDRTQGYAHMLNGRPAVTAQLAAGGRLARGSALHAVALTASKDAADVAGTGVIQRFELRQVAEARADITDLHYRYDAVPINADENLHITTVYTRPRDGRAITVRYYHNYATGNWRWAAQPKADVRPVIRGHEAAAVEWAARHHNPPAPAAPAAPAAPLNLASNVEFPPLGG